jgi:hypothetical protein
VSKIISKVTIISISLIGLSMPAYAMKRGNEACADEPSPKRQKIELAYQPLPKRQKFNAYELSDEIKDEAFYTKYLMYEFFKKLHVLAWEKNISSPEKRLVWLQTMYGIIYKAADTAWKIGMDAAFVELKPWEIALDETRKQAVSSTLYLAGQTAGKIVKKIDNEKAFMAENNLACVHDLNIWSEIKNKVQEIVDDKLKNIESQNAYSIAVDEVFKLVLENFEKIFDRTYHFYLQASLVSKRLERVEALNELLKSHIAAISPAAMSFLAPWLVHFLPFDALSCTQRPLCELLWTDTYLYPILYPLVRPLLFLRARDEINLDLISVISNLIMQKLISELYEKCPE